MLWLAVTEQSDWLGMGTVILMEVILHCQRRPKLPVANSNKQKVTKRHAESKAEQKDT